MHAILAILLRSGSLCSSSRVRVLLRDFGDSQGNAVDIGLREIYLGSEYNLLWLKCEQFL